MVGTIFLWIFWPSFNSALVDGPEQGRAIMNTYLSLAACTVTSFVISAFVNHEKKLDMVHVQNSTLAGGVAVGSCVNLLIGPHGAILIGICAGILSVLGYRYITVNFRFFHKTFTVVFCNFQPALLSNLGLSDTCGVNNLHGMPAILSAIFSSFYAFSASKEKYGSSLDSIFPAMKNTTEEHEFIIGVILSL
jgi:ammonium transporter Rh